jgi:uncharacterized protein YdeI (BOF family)
MKRLTLIFALVLAIGSFAATSYAVEVGSNVINTVSEAKVSGPDDFAALTGSFVKKINDGEYIFSDKTGEIIVRVAPDMESKVDSCLGNVAHIEGHVAQNIVEVEVDAKKIIISNKLACNK